MCSVYSKICKEAQNNLGRYSVPSGYDICNFPLVINVGYSSDDFLKVVFGKYRDLLSQQNIEISSITEALMKGITDVISTYKNGDIYTAYSYFEKVLDTIPIDSLLIKEITANDGFYRMRKEPNLTEEHNFYCLNSELRYLCSSMRYSISGYPCFYVGYSKNVCKVEIAEHGSIISLRLKRDEKIKVLDLTYDNDPSYERKFINFWPLIAACNMKYGYITDAKFKEEYVIPQFLTMYVLRRRERLGNIGGLRYFSTRNRNLDILGRGEKDYRNVVFFPLGDGDKGIEKLMKKFHFGNAENI